MVAIQKKEYDFAVAILKASSELVIKKANMNISMNKKYKVNGLALTVLTVTKPGEFPIVGYTPEGFLYCFDTAGTSAYGGYSLIEASPYEDFVINEPVMVRDSHDKHWCKGHFTGINEDSGWASVSSYSSWMRGNATSVSWPHCRRPTAEELAE